MAVGEGDGRAGARVATGLVGGAVVGTGVTALAVGEALGWRLGSAFPPAQDVSRSTAPTSRVGGRTQERVGGL